MAKKKVFPAVTVWRMRSGAFIFSLTQTHHVRNSGGGGGWVKSIRHSTFFSLSTLKLQKIRTNEKRHPIVFGFKAGLRQAGEGGGIFPRILLWIKFCALSSPPSPARPVPSIHLSVLHCAAYFKRSMSSCVRPRLSSCMVGSEARWGKALRSFSQHSSSRLGTASQILNREPVLLFSWMFTTPPWMYMQPAWGQRQGKRETCKFYVLYIV